MRSEPNSGSVNRKFHAYNDYIPPRWGWRAEGGFPHCQPEKRLTGLAQASTADLDPTPAGNQSHRKQGSVRPPAARSQNARHSGQLGRQRSGMLEPGLAAEARALPRGAATAPLSPRALCPPGTAPAWGRGACLIPLRVTRVLTTLPLAGCLLRDLASGQND